MNNIISRISEDRDLLMCAISIKVFDHVNTHMRDYLDGYGSMHMYDLIADIVDELMQGEDYQKYLADYHYFHSMGTCFDWYYMDKCIKMITEERIHRVAFPSLYKTNN